MRQRWIPALILVGYSAVLIRVLIFKNLMFSIGHLRFRISTQSGQTNFVPLKTIASYARGDHGPLIAVVNLVGNIALFVPIGLLVPLVYPAMTGRASLALAVAVGLAVESAEVVFRVGAFDVDDLILNAVGVMIGYAVFAIARRRAGGQAVARR